MSEKTIQENISELIEAQKTLLEAQLKQFSEILEKVQQIKQPQTSTKRAKAVENTNPAQAETDPIRRCIDIFELAKQKVDSLDSFTIQDISNALNPITKMLDLRNESVDVKKVAAVKLIDLAEYACKHFERIDEPDNDILAEATANVRQSVYLSFIYPNSNFQFTESRNFKTLDMTPVYWLLLSSVDLAELLVENEKLSNGVCNLVFDALLDGREPNALEFCSCLFSDSNNAQRGLETDRLAFLSALSTRYSDQYNISDEDSKFCFMSIFLAPLLERSARFVEDCVFNGSRRGRNNCCDTSTTMKEYGEPCINFFKNLAQVIVSNSSALLHLTPNDPNAMHNNLSTALRTLRAASALAYARRNQNQRTENLAETETKIERDLFSFLTTFEREYESNNDNADRGYILRRLLDVLYVDGKDDLIDRKALNALEIATPGLTEKFEFLCLLNSNFTIADDDLRAFLSNITWQTMHDETTERQKKIFELCMDDLKLMDDVYGDSLRKDDGRINLPSETVLKALNKNVSYVLNSAQTTKNI